MSSVTSSALWFLGIIVMIPVGLWLLKRTPMGGGAAHGVMRSVAMLPISASQRIVTIEVGQGDDRKWLVLGVTPHTITTLHTMDPQSDTPPVGVPQAPVPPFAQLLGKFRRDAGSSNTH